MDGEEWRVLQPTRTDNDNIVLLMVLLFRHYMGDWRRQIFFIERRMLKNLKEQCNEISHLACVHA